jgi:hypothetical protein
VNKLEPPSLLMRRNRLWKVIILLAVNPFFTRKSHPLDIKLFNLFSAQDAWYRHTNDTVFARSPYNQVAVLAMKPSRKILYSEPLFTAYTEKLSNESAFRATMAVIVNQFRLVRLLILCYRSCTCNTRPLDSSFFLFQTVLLFFK